MTRRAYGAHEAFGTRAHGGDGIVEVAGVVGLADMEGVDAVGLKQLGEFHRLVDEQAAAAELRVLGDDRQLVVDADVRRTSRMARTTARAKRVRFSKLPPYSSVRWLISGEHSEPTRRSPCASMASAPACVARRASAVIWTRISWSRSPVTSLM